MFPAPLLHLSNEFLHSGIFFLKVATFDFCIGGRLFFVLQNTFPITSFIEPGKPLGSDVKILKLKANKKLSQNFSNCRNLSQPRERKTHLNSSSQNREVFV